MHIDDETIESFAPVGGTWLHGDSRAAFRSAYQVALEQGLSAEAAQAVLMNVVAAVQYEMDARVGALGLDQPQPPRHTVEADKALRDELVGSATLRHGRMMAGDMAYLLAYDEGGATRWATVAFTEAQSREAVRAYARWLLRCAEVAQ